VVSPEPGRNTTTTALNIVEMGSKMQPLLGPTSDKDAEDAGDAGAASTTAAADENGDQKRTGIINDSPSLGEPIVTVEEEDVWGGPKTLRRKIYVIFNGDDQDARMFQAFLIALIVLNIVNFIVSTEPAYRNDKTVFNVIDGISVILFTIEYALRLWCIVENPSFRDPVRGRLSYAVTISALVDMFSILPFYISFFVPAELPFSAWLRGFRILRILKAEQYSHSVGSLYRVFVTNRDMLLLSLGVAFLLLLVTSTFLYYAQRGEDSDRDYGSIGRCMYLSILMLTAQGIPENPKSEFPVTTKLVFAFAAFFSVAIFALPAALLASGFEDEAAKVAKWKEANRAERKRCRRLGIPFVPLDYDAVNNESEYDESRTPSERASEASAKGMSFPVAVCPHCHKAIHVSFAPGG